MGKLEIGIILFVAFLAVFFVNGDLGKVEKVPFDTLAIGTGSRITEAGEFTVTDQETWKALWARHRGLDNNKSSPPEVNFDKEMIIAVFATDSSAGVKLKIIQIYKRKNYLKVIYRLTYPYCTKCGATSGTGTLYHIVKIKKTDLPVKFMQS